MTDTTKAIMAFLLKGKKICGKSWGDGQWIQLVDGKLECSYYNHYRLYDIRDLIKYGVKLYTEPKNCDLVNFTTALSEFLNNKKQISVMWGSHSKEYFLKYNEDRKVLELVAYFECEGKQEVYETLNIEDVIYYDKRRWRVYND